jgi:hypothetical protein
MQTATVGADTSRYAQCIANSKRVRWDIDDDVIRGRRFDQSNKFLPDGLTKMDALDFLSDEEKRFLSQVQGRTYANIFGMVERYINAKVLELSRDHWLGDQTALEGLVRFCDEELKHQALFRRVEELIGETMPAGYRFEFDPNAIADVVLGKSTWAVLALTLHIELFTQLHYRESIDPDEGLSPLFKDVFLFHWKEESQHAIMDDMEWRRIDASMTDEERDSAVDEFIELVVAVDGILQQQAAHDAAYFTANCGRTLSGDEAQAIETELLKAYRWQYILSGAQQPQFTKALSEKITEQQGARIQSALATLM